jgi:hypothetical protein
VNAVANAIPTLTILGHLARPPKTPYTEIAEIPHVIRKLPSPPRSNVAVWAIGASDLPDNATTITNPIPSWVTPAQRRRSRKVQQQEPGAKALSYLRRAIN